MGSGGYPSSSSSSSSNTTRFPTIGTFSTNESYNSDNNSSSNFGGRTSPQSNSFTDSNNQSTRETGIIEKLLVGPHKLFIVKTSMKYSHIKLIDLLPWLGNFDDLLFL
jgi:hypothetical protein